MRNSVLALIVLVAAASWLQAVFIGLDTGSFLGAMSDGSLGEEYTRALAAGQSHLLPLPDPAQRILDASPYGGKYYVYFGAAPFLLLSVPWLLLSKTFLSTQAMVWLFNLAGYFGYGATLVLVSHKQRGRLPLLQGTCALIAIVFGGFTWTLSSRALIYEVENAGAYAAFAWVIFLLAWGEFQHRSTRIYLIASALLGFALACRPNYFPAGAVIVALIGYRTLQGSAPWGLRVRATALRLLPLAVICAALLIWNAVRFGSILDFGVKPFSQTAQSTGLLFTSLRNVPYNAEGYLMGTVRFVRYFPFFARPGLRWFAPAPHEEEGAWVYGCLWIVPFLIFVWLLGRNRIGVAHWKLWTALGLAGLGNFLYLCVIGFSSYRYSVDFMGPWVLLAAVGAIQVTEIGSGWTRRFTTGALIICSAWTAVASFLDAASIAQQVNLVDERRPEAFRKMAAPFNGSVYLVERLFGDGPRKPRLLVRLPSVRMGQVEPLLVTGVPSRQDFLYIYYVIPGFIELGFESMGHGGPVTGPIPIDYSVVHRFDVFLGSFLPPNDHPLLKGVPQPDLASSRQVVRVKLDSHIVLETESSLHPVLATMQVGRSVDDGAFGRLFSGQILAFEHPRISNEDVSPFSAVDYGPIRISLRGTPNNVNEIQPLLSVGLRPRAGVLALRRTHPGTAQLVWFEIGRPSQESAPFALAPGQAIDVDCAAGFLLPNRSPTTVRREITPSTLDRLVCTVDGRTVLNAATDLQAISPGTVVVGRNAAGLSGLAPLLEETLLSAVRQKITIPQAPSARQSGTAL